MNFIQSILNLFGRRETKRRGKYADKKTTLAEFKANNDKLLIEINKTGKTDFKKYRDSLHIIRRGLNNEQPNN